MGYRRSGIDWSEIFSLKTLLYLLPLILTAVYVGICFTPVIDNMYLHEKPNFFIDGVVENGWYNMFFKRIVENWMMESVPFDILWLGTRLLQVGAWVLGLIVDLIFSLILLILGGILALIYLVIEYVYIFILPAGVIGLSIFNIIHGIYEEDEPLLKFLSFLVCITSILGIVYYYMTLAH